MRAAHEGRSNIIVEAHRNRPSQILSGLVLFDHYVCCDEIPAFIIIQLCLVCHKNAKNAFRTVFKENGTQHGLKLYNADILYIEMTVLMSRTK